METITKLVKAMFFVGDDPDKSAVQKLKDFLLTAFIIEHLLIGALWYWCDDEVTDDGATIENIDGIYDN